MKRYVKTALSDMPISSELAAMAKRVVGFDLAIRYEEWSKTPSLALIPRIIIVPALLKDRDENPKPLTQEEMSAGHEVYRDNLPTITPAQLEELGIKTP
jgi:hypothetical protein